MKNIKKINFTLVDGNHNGIILADLKGWESLCYKIPRIAMPNYENSNLAQKGIFFLFSQQFNTVNRVYIDISDNLQISLKTHLEDYKNGGEEQYWTSSVVFTGKFLSNEQLKHLQNRLVFLADNCNKCKVLSKGLRVNDEIDEKENEIMNNYIDNIKLLLEAMGYDVFGKNPDKEQKKIKK